MKKLMYLLLVALVCACGNRNAAGSSASSNESDAQAEMPEVSEMANSGEKDERDNLTTAHDYVYDADWCKLEDMTMPVINTRKITGDYAAQFNSEIKALYDKLVAGFDWDAEKDGGHGPRSDYQWYVTGDILSISLVYDNAGFSVGGDNYKTFHLDVKTGKPVSNDELIHVADLTPEDIMSAVEKANNRAVIDTENYNNYKSYYTDGKIEYENNHHYRNLSMYLGKKGLTIYVWVTDLPFENGAYFLPFFPAEWRNAEVTNITIDEAVDILAKKLNDKNLKYLHGEESESEMVDGENTYYIRAYYDSPDGESIATLGHFYIGCRSGKIYIMDIINGTDPIPYEGSGYEK